MSENRKAIKKRRKPLLFSTPKISLVRCVSTCVHPKQKFRKSRKRPITVKTTVNFKRRRSFTHTRTPMPFPPWMDTANIWCSFYVLYNIIKSDFLICFSCLSKGALFSCLNRLERYILICIWIVAGSKFCVSILIE